MAVHEEKRISLTHKQAGVSAGVVGLLLALQPFIKGMIQDETKASEARIASLEISMQALVKSHERLVDDLKTSNRESVTEIMDRMEKGWAESTRKIEAAESRFYKVTDHQQKQIDELIALRFKSRNSY